MTAPSLGLLQPSARQAARVERARQAARVERARQAACVGRARQAARVEHVFPHTQ